MTRMNRLFFNGFLVATLLTTLPTISHAIGFNINWTGSNGNTMTGMFSYDDSLIGSGPIDETDLDSFMIEAFLNGGSIGSFTADTTQANFGQGAGAFAFNFNFDTDSEMFLVGGSSSGPQGQLWNANSNPEIGFFSSNATQFIELNIVRLDLISFPGVGNPSNSTLTATRKPTAPIPEPSTLLLFGTGVLGLLGYATRRKRQAQAAA